MMTLIVVLAAVALVVLAGEAVRSQCRRMLDRPIRLVTDRSTAAAESAPAHAVAA